MTSGNHVALPTWHPSSIALVHTWQRVGSSELEQVGKFELEHKFEQVDKRVLEDKRGQVHTLGPEHKCEQLVHSG